MWLVVQDLDIAVQLSSEAQTVSYHWGAQVREWWVNDETGLEARMTVVGGTLLPVQGPAIGVQIDASAGWMA